MNKDFPTTLHFQKGLSLIELMLAITLSFLLILGILTLFNGTKTTFNTNEAQSRTQENGRFALEILKRELRELHTHGMCAGRVTITDHVNTCPSMPNGADSPLIGWEFAGTAEGNAYTIPSDLDPALATAGSWTTADGTAFPPGLNNRLVPGSDIFVFRRFLPTGLVVNATNQPNEISLSGLQIGQAGAPGDGSLMLVTNCSTADVFRQNGTGGLDKSGSGFCGGVGGNWSTAYGLGAQVFEQQEIAYFVGLRTLANGDQVPGLYRFNLSLPVGANNPQELVEGIENLQIRYGYSRDASQGGDGQSVRFDEDWLTADEVPNWRQVIAMRLSMSVRSAENPAGDGDRTALVLNLAGSNVTTPGDGRLRQPFSTTVALRNQMIVP